MKITMTQNYDWPVPGKRSWIAFKAGWSGRVTRAQARDIVAAGAGVAKSDETAPRTTRRSVK